MTCRMPFLHRTRSSADRGGGHAHGLVLILVLERFHQHVPADTRRLHVLLLAIPLPVPTVSAPRHYALATRDSSPITTRANHSILVRMIRVQGGRTGRDRPSLAPLEVIAPNSAVMPQDTPARVVPAVVIMRRERTAPRTLERMG